MMNAQRYPLDHPPYNATPKTLAMQAAAKRLGLEWMLPILAWEMARRANGWLRMKGLFPNRDFHFAGSFSSCPRRHSSRYRGRSFSHRHFSTVHRRTLDLSGTIHLRGGEPPPYYGFV
jgi:hypothetical protein